MKKYKFIHIFWHSDIKFNPQIVKMINENPEYFDLKEHYLVTPHHTTYDAIKIIVFKLLHAKS